MICVEIVVGVDPSDTRLHHAPVHEVESEGGQIENENEEELANEGPLVRVVKVGEIARQLDYLPRDVVDRLRDQEAQLEHSKVFEDFASTYKVPRRYSETKEKAKELANT